MPAVPVVPAAPVARPRARVIAITSGKGGVGKSNLAVNLAARFAQAGRRTVLLDADMGLANADVLCGMNLRLNLAHVIARRASLNEILAAAPGGFRLIGGASGLAKMADLPDEEHRRLLGALAELERSSDLMLIDTGAGISRNVLSFTAAADHVLVITTPEPTAIADAYAMIKVISRQQQGQASRPISLVVNQVKSAAEARAVFERMAKVALQFLGVKLGDAGFMPLDPAVSAAVRNRKPFLLASPRCPASVCVTRLATRLEAGLAPAAAPASTNSLGFFAAVAKLVRPQLAPGFP
jgi:flagellar biosynthesis protein FlhG